MITEEIMNSLVPQLRGTYIGADLGEVATFDVLNSSCVWVPRIDDESIYGTPIVIGCNLVSVDVNDPSVIISERETEVKITGEYGLGTFDQLSYEFKDIETNETFKLSGWPPTDPRVKYMYKLNQDPRANRDVNYIVDFIIRFDVMTLESSPLPDLESDIETQNPLTYNRYVYNDDEEFFVYRKDRIIFNHTVRNYSFRKLASELKRVLEENGN